MSNRIMALHLRRRVDNELIDFGRRMYNNILQVVEKTTKYTRNKYVQ